jgi:hypothetical protein
MYLIWDTVVKKRFSKKLSPLPDKKKINNELSEELKKSTTMDNGNI